MQKNKILDSSMLPAYKRKQPLTLSKHFKKIKERGADYGYALTEASVYSSQIEGNPLDLDTFIKFDQTGMSTKTRSFREIKNLGQAYGFARKHAINEKNMLHIHELMTDPEVLEEKYRGKYRDKGVFVGHGYQVAYTGANPELLPGEMQKLFNDIAQLKKQDLSMAETFYYASMVHLVFVLIHPFADGNGRTARLLEKWFLAHHLGNKAWFILSEKLYLQRLNSYHKNLSLLGESYDKINYQNAIPFLKMLPMALRLK